LAVKQTIFCIWWGILNIIIGGGIDSLGLILFGIGILAGGLCVAIERDKEAIKCQK